MKPPQLSSRDKAESFAIAVCAALLLVSSCLAGPVLPVMLALLVFAGAGLVIFGKDEN